MAEIVYGNMGGSLFSASLTPNSSSPDRPIGPCPQDAGDSYYQAHASRWARTRGGRPAAKGLMRRRGASIPLALTPQWLTDPCVSLAIPST